MKYLFLTITFLLSLFPFATNTRAYGECEEYGLMVEYDALSNTCQCYKGYVFETDVLGNKTCVKGDSVCGKKYGWGSHHDTLTNKCECDRGYVLSKKSFGSGLECKSCTSKHGIHSTYNGLTRECECDDEYTLDDDNQCVEKQHNVYFVLEELDDDEYQAVIRSEYDGNYYNVSYGMGCLPIWRYEGNRIVVNLGTDYSLDAWDKIVLQDDDRTCNIISVEEVDSDFKLKKDEENDISYIPLQADVIEVDTEASLYEQAISALKQKAIIGGYPDGTFKPRNPINRAEFMKIVMGAIGTPSSGTHCFSDVKDEWFAGYICAGAQQQIISGYVDGSFRPDNNINVVESLKIVLKAFAMSVRSPQVHETWFDPFIEVSRANGLYLPSFTSPGDNLTRGEMAELINRTLGIQEQLSH